ncbi:IclR family transcriptional regulator [Ruegeria profundi]|uniref:IclR family transcriptional regulator n=1 Tax=Ruegeria profundi TaxID=1685378 RepID=A0A0X3U0A8_9RHOB|nr:IclR family transcriptional regulator [Ruegeria profundi]KUJ81292.1 hypothetical protein AVO44_05410 [Ruegeria profundi]
MEKFEGDAETDRQFVTALARGLDILSAFDGQSRYLSNSALATRSGLAKPTVSRLTHTLTRTGHLVRNPESGEYRLGAKVLQLGFSALSAMSVSELYLPEMEALSVGPNPYVTVALAEQVGNRAIYVATQKSTQAVTLSLYVGARLPLFYSAVGRAILARLEPDARAAAVSLGAAEFPEQKARIQASVDIAVGDYETLGYVRSFGDWKKEINAIAVPVTSLDGSTIYGLNVGGPSFLVSPEELENDYAERLMVAGKQLSSK